MSVLLIDIGNTSVKACVADSLALGKEIYSGADLATLLDTLCEQININAIAKIYIASVQVADVEGQCQQVFGSHCEVHVARTEKFALINGTPLKNSYADITTMGVDRWLAMCAAQALAQQHGLHNSLVVDAGTAITCDALVQGEHQGGFIAPGLNTLQHALLANTQRVSGSKDWPETVSFGQDTGKCVVNGCLAQLQGIVDVASAQIQQYCEDYLLVLSGGDGPRLKNTLNRPCERLENVVLYGLWVRFVQNA